MNETNQVYDALRRGSAAFDALYKGSLGDYAYGVAEQFLHSSSTLMILREVVLESSKAVIYDGLSLLQASLMQQTERLRWGRYMTSFDLAVEIANGVPIGKSVVDPAAGMGVLLAATLPNEGIARLGIEKSDELVRLGRLAHVLSGGDTATYWCRQGDTFAPAPYQPSADTLISSPPWVLRDNIPASTLEKIAMIEIYDELLSDELFDLCVPFTVEAIRKYLCDGGSFIAAMPARIATAPEWDSFRRGELSARRGLSISLDFLDPPQRYRNAYPTGYVLCTGQLYGRA